MAKVFTGKVISTKMHNTVVVEVTHLTPHKLYKKLLKRSKHFKVDTNGQEVMVGKWVKITEIKPMSKEKYFKILEVLVEQHAKAGGKTV